jgi:hypothetical protein
MTGRLGTASPRTRARLTGVVYLLFFATAVLGAVVPEAFNYMGEGHAKGKIIINV